MKEQIDAGDEFLRKFQERFAVSAAFWLKENEDAQWFLFVASDEFDINSLRPAYDEALRIDLGMNNPNFDRFRLMFIRTTDPLAQSAIEFYKRYPDQRPTHILGKVFGGTSVLGGYLYPPPAPARV